MMLTTGGPDRVTLNTAYEALPGSDLESIQEFCGHYLDPSFGETHIFVEQYRDRGTVFNTHATMRQLETLIRSTIPESKLIDNTGIKKIVTSEMMKLLDVWDFDQKTHHQDLRSAARIALYGALKDEKLNRVLYHLITRLLREQWRHRND